MPFFSIFASRFYIAESRCFQFFSSLEKSTQCFAIKYDLLTAVISEMTFSRI